ncbi:MAG: CoA transferase [Dehalococcoidales bacterium]|nr:CoA transferase [Dehalococcoidales bacterium]
MSQKLLEGVRVVDITVWFTGPLTTQVLADCGAEVIRISTSSRTQGAGGGGRAINKKSITINFREPKGLDLLYRLIAKSDVVVENHAAGTLKRRGLGYDDLKKVKSDIIMLSTCMQGQTGPYASHAAFGHMLTALSGFNQIAGWPDKEPGWLAAYTDFVAPRFHAISILGALEYKRRTGKGQYLDASQNEGGMQFMAPAILDYTANHRVAERTGNRCSYAAPHNVYQCLGQDAWCAIAVFSDEEWRSFCRVVGASAMPEDSRFATLSARKENEEELDSLINEWTKTRNAVDVMNVMQAVGVAAGLAEAADYQMETDPQLKARNYFYEVATPDGQTLRGNPGVQFMLSKTPLERRAGSEMGADNDYVFNDLLGLSDEEVTELVQAKVID